MGTFELVMLDRHGNNLPSDLVTRMHSSIAASATASSALPPNLNQTAQTLLQVFQVLRAGEVLQDPVLLNAGHQIWHMFYEFTKSLFNNPHF